MDPTNHEYHSLTFFLGQLQTEPPNFITMDMKHGPHASSAWNLHCIIFPGSIFMPTYFHLSLRHFTCSCTGETLIAVAFAFTISRIISRIKGTHEQCPWNQGSIPAPLTFSFSSRMQNSVVLISDTIAIHQNRFQDAL